jgi:hypothetical protein
VKAQSLRRLLTFSNVALVIAVGVFVGWYLVKVRPATGDDGKRVAWVGPAMKAYEVDAAGAHKVTHWQVDEKDFEHIIRPDLMDMKRPTAPGVWPYVGPVPPKVERVLTPAAVVEAPKGLSALGKIVSAIVGDPRGRDTISIKWNGPPPRIATYAVGDREPMEAKPPTRETAERVEPVGANAQPKPRRPGKYLTGVEWVNSEGEEKDPLLKVSYDEVIDASKPAEHKEELMSMTQTATSGGTLAVESSAGSAPLPGGRASPALAGTASVGPVPPRESVRLTPVKTADNHFRVELDETAHRYMTGADIEREVLRDVKSEDVKDSTGGVRVTGLDQNSVLAQFDVQRGDILRSINGVAVRNRAEAIEVAKRISPDVASVTVVVERDGVLRTYDIDPRDPKVRAAAGKVRYGGK